MKYAIWGMGIVCVVVSSGCQSRYPDSYSRAPRHRVIPAPVMGVAPRTPAPSAGVVATNVILPATSRVASTSAIPPAVTAATGAVSSVASAPVASPTAGPATNSAIEKVGDVQRRLHYRFKDKAAASAFLRLLGKKRDVLEELTILSRLHAEKADELKRFADALQEQFAVKPDVDYEYDAGALAINELVKSKGGGAPRSRLHMKLKDKSAEQGFVRLVAAKRVTAEEMGALQLLLREKKIESDEVDRLLAELYAVIKDRSYQYDAASMTLYELMKLPQGIEAPKAIRGDKP